MSDPKTSDAKTPRDGLSTRIIFLVFLSTLATALVVSGVSIHSSYTFVSQRINETFPDVAEASVERTHSWLESGSGALKQLSEDASLLTWQSEHAAGSRRGKAAILASILEKELPAVQRFYSGLFVLDPEGKLLAAAGSGIEMDSLRDLLKERSALNSELVDIMHTAKIRGELSQVENPTFQAFDPERAAPVPIAARPLMVNGQKIGSLHGVFRRQGLEGQLRDDRMAASGDVYLADSSGWVLASARGAGGQVGSFGSAVVSAMDSPKVREFASPDGRDAMGSVLPLGTLGWTIVVQQTTQEAFQPLFSTLKRALMANFAFFLIFSVLASKIAAAIVRPIRALSAGARRISEGELDVEIPEGKTSGEILLLTRTFNDMTEQLRKNRKQIETNQRALQAQNEAFQRTNEMLSQLAITDGLTKLHNHRYFQDQLTRELKRLSRTGEPLTILLFDIDDFKKLNDTLGHAAGDEFLVRFAQILNETVRETDLVARYGGEEFVVVAVGTSLEGAEILAEKIRSAVAESSFLLGNATRPSSVTVSIGVAQYAGSRKRLFQAADDCLYRAKAAGKNCVIVAHENECLPKDSEPQDELG